MADILIRMEMPKSCSDCPMCYDQIECAVRLIRFWGEELQINFCKERHPACPLVELPEHHGDLIDKDALYELVKQRGKNWAGEWCDFECHITGNDIKNAPVVIPSNKEKTDGN